MLLLFFGTINEVEKSPRVNFRRDAISNWMQYSKDPNTE